MHFYNSSGPGWGLLLFWLASAISPACLRAQPFNPSFEVITTADGLPSNTVLSATRDHQGFMWFGTRACPVRYDGSSFRRYTEFETNFITGLAPDSLNNIWFASDLAGIGWIDGKTHRLKTVSQTQARGQTGALYIDRHGEVWYSDMDGVNRIDPRSGNVRHYPFQPNAYVWIKGSFVEDASGNLWVISRDNGLFRYDRGRDSLVCVWGPQGAEKMEPELVVMIHGVADETGRIWISTYNAGLVMYDTRTGIHQSFTPDNGRPVTAIARGVDQQGRNILWVGTDQGLGTFTPEERRFHFYTGVMKEPFSVNAIFRDSVENIIWACTSSGVVKHHPDGNVIRTVRFPSVIPETTTIQTLIPDRSAPGQYFLGLSGSGIARWNRNTGEFKLMPLPGRMEVRWIIQRHDGKLLIGGNRWDYQRPGIFLFDPFTEKFSQTPLTTAANRMFSVPFFMYGVLDKDGRLHVGNSDEGVHVFDETDGTEVTPWPLETQRQMINHTNLINDVMICRNGFSWLAMYDGIYQARTDAGTFLKTGIKSESHAVTSLLQSRDGTIWATCWGEIIRLDSAGNPQTVLTTRDGFFDREIKGIAEDANGHLWIGNYEGLYRYQPEKDKLMRFTTHDGLISNNTLDRVFVSHDGIEVFVGQPGGLNILNLTELQDQSFKPRLAISLLQVDSKEYPVDRGNPLVLTSDQQAISINFVALNYRNDNEYAFYLEGFDENWIETGGEHQANYTNLDPGSYTLHVKAANPFGGWSSETLAWNIIVKPAYYETWWFKVILIILAGLAGYGLYRYRVSQLLHVQLVRNRISADLHDELGSTLSGISIMGTLARQTLPPEHPSGLLVDRMVDDVSQINTSLDDIVWNISPKNDSLSNLIARLTRYASELFEARNIRYSFDFPETADHIKLSMEDRRNLYLILKESINNLVKHAQCTEARIAMTIDSRKLKVEIADNGVGFDCGAESDRNGMKNLRERARQLEATISIHSAAREGTRIVVEVRR